MRQLTSRKVNMKMAGKILTVSPVTVVRADVVIDQAGLEPLGAHAPIETHLSR
jgi:hypothetical protein